MLDNKNNNKRKTMVNRKLNLERGLRIKRLRTAKNLSQQQLAEELNLSKQAISKFEQGVGFKIDTAAKIADYFDIDMNWFLHGDAKTQKRIFSNESLAHMVLKAEITRENLKMSPEMQRIKLLEVQVSYLINKLSLVENRVEEDNSLLTSMLDKTD